MDYASLGREIRKRRKWRHWTQDQLAEHVGISLAFLGHIERGTQKASIETLVKIANILNATTDELLCGSLELTDICYFPFKTEDHFMVIRKALDKIESEYYGSRLT